MKVSDMQLFKGLLASLAATILAAAILSYFYPVFTGGANAQEYIALSLRGDPEVWRLVLAVFLVSSTFTVAMFVVLAICAIVPLLKTFPQLADASVQSFVLFGVGASLAVVGLLWLVQDRFGILMSEDSHFAQLVILIDGPVGLVTLRAAIRNQAIGGQPVA